MSDHIRDLAKKLCLAYPDANRAVLQLDDVYHYITSLPDYKTWSRPSEQELQAILWQWMRQASMGEED